MSVSRGVLALSALQLAVAAVLLAAGVVGGSLGSVGVVVVPLAVGFAVVGFVQMHLEFGRHAYAVTLVEALLVAALLLVRPAEVVVGFVLGELLVCARRRHSPLKMLFNGSSAAATGSTAALAFVALPAAGADSPVAWGAALVAVAAYAVANHASTCAVLAVVERRRFDQFFLASAAPAAVATTVAASMGLVAVVLASVTPLATLLAVPLVLLMVVETRRLATHRAEHLRFERLYAASSRTGGLQSLPDVMATLAGEARSLVTGAVGICCTVDRAGEWHAVIVDDEGARPARPVELTAVLSLANRRELGEMRAAQVPAVVREVLPSLESLVVARTDEGAAAPVVLGVVRQLDDEDGARGRGEVLAAFIGHAALTIANARLYGDVEEALARQVDLNRQKDDFVAAVSHELRTPLTAMVGSVSTLRRMDARLTTEHRTALVDIAARQGQRLQRLIEELLLLATVEHGGATVSCDDVVSLRRLVDEIVDDVGERYGARPDVQFETLGVPDIRSDEQKVRQILANLIENACKYAPGAPVRVSAEVDAVRAVIEVVDRGPGIATEDRERVFDRFVQLDQSSTRRQGGTGLGLYLCRQLAGLLGGTLALSEADGGGCRFTLTLPQPVLHLPDVVATECAPVGVALTTGGLR